MGAIGFEGQLSDESSIGPLSLMAATAIERARSFRATAKAAAIAETETLRSAILDALRMSSRRLWPRCWPLQAGCGKAGDSGRTRWK